MSEIKFELKQHRQMSSFELRKLRLEAISKLLKWAIVSVFILCAGVQFGKYRLERQRIDVTRAALTAGANQSIAGINPALSTTTSLPVSAPLPTDKQVSEGVYVLREMLEVLPETLGKEKSGSAGTSIDWGKFANTAIDKLVGAGKMTVKEANSLRQELLKPTIDVGVYAAKAAVDRFISGKTSAKPEDVDRPGTGSAAAVGNHVEITMYGAKEHVALTPPKPQKKSAPCDKAPVTGKKLASPETTCKASQPAPSAVPQAEPQLDHPAIPS